MVSNAFCRGTNDLAFTSKVFWTDLFHVRHKIVEQINGHSNPGAYAPGCYISPRWGFLPIANCLPPTQLLIHIFLLRLPPGFHYAQLLPPALTHRAITFRPDGAFCLLLMPTAYSITHSHFSPEASTGISLNLAFALLLWETLWRLCVTLW